MVGAQAAVVGTAEMGMGIEFFGHFTALHEVARTAGASRVDTFSGTVRGQRLSMKTFSFSKITFASTRRRHLEQRDRVKS